MNNPNSDASANTPPRNETSPQPQMGNILVIDDEEMVTNTIAAMLQEHHQIDIFHSAERALQNFAPNKYDIALIDLGLPNMPGDQVATLLREKDPHLTTILITGWELSEDDPQLQPFDDMLLKPFEMHKLRSAIQDALNKKNHR